MHPTITTGGGVHACTLPAVANSASFGHQELQELLRGLHFASFAQAVSARVFYQVRRAITLLGQVAHDGHIAHVEYPIYDAVDKFHAVCAGLGKWVHIQKRNVGKNYASYRCVSNATRQSV
jgi:hypothetical protein